MTHQELKISATYIKKLASFPDAEDRISLYLDSLFAIQQPQKDTFNEPENGKSKSTSSIIKFTQQEIKNMSTTFKNRHMHVYNLKLKMGDRIIFCSDGVTQAALGTKELKLGVRRDGLIKIVLNKLNEKPFISSDELTQHIVKQIEIIEPDHKLKDDTSVSR